MAKVKKEKSSHSEEQNKNLTFHNRYWPAITNRTLGFFYIRNRKGSEKWSLYFESSLNGKVEQESVPTHLYRDLGLDKEKTTVVQARAIVKDYNKLRKKFGHQTMTREQLRAYKKLQAKKLNEKTFLQSEFKFDFINKLQDESEGSFNHKARIEFTADVMLKMVHALEIQPYQYKDAYQKILNYFEEKQFSVSYSLDIIAVLNKWGQYLHRKTGIMFERFPPMSGSAKNRIRQSQELKEKKVRRASKPIDEDILNRIQKNMLSTSDEEERILDQKRNNWLLLSFSFALRPKECDDFLKDASNKIKIRADGIRYLEIEQTKLVNLSREERTKRIPITNQFQLDVEKLLVDKSQFIRPTSEWIDRMCKDPAEQYKITEVYDSYTGRKGYVSLAKKDQSLLSIARQMGHIQVQTTYSAYVDKSAIDFDENAITKSQKHPNLTVAPSPQPVLVPSPETAPEDQENDKKESA